MAGFNCYRLDFDTQSVVTGPAIFFVTSTAYRYVSAIRVWGAIFGSLAIPIALSAKPNGPAVNERVRLPVTVQNSSFQLIVHTGNQTQVVYGFGFNKI